MICSVRPAVGHSGEAAPLQYLTSRLESMTALGVLWPTSGYRVHAGLNYEGMQGLHYSLKEL